MAVTNSSAAMDLVTPTQVSMRLALSRESPVSSSFTLQTRRIPVEQSLVTKRVPEMLNAVVGIPLLEQG
jgi:hypothetical protein